MAVSAGIDSMTLVRLCVETGLSVALAHCNFSLRGSESDADESFVRDFAEKHGLEFHSQTFDTSSYARDFGLSIQVAARDLRYKWFLEVAEKHGYDFILTAHHLDDTLETFLINLCRGTGLDGLTGIPARNGRIARPLLWATREQIYRYALQESISWREDSTNNQSLYLRNTIRHEIVPRLKSLNRNFEDSFTHTLSYLRQAASMTRDAAVMAWGLVAIEKEDYTLIKIDELLRIPDYPAYLHYWLNGYGFSAWPDIYHLPHAETGKRVQGIGYTLTRDRGTLVLARNRAIDDNEYEVTLEGIREPVQLKIDPATKMTPADKSTIFTDGDVLKFPLKLRTCRKGDYFYPAGMQGKKKVSKFLRDQKLSQAEKSRVWLLLSQERIVWVIGLRQDRRFMVTDNTRHILQITT